MKPSLHDINTALGLVKAAPWPEPAKRAALYALMAARTVTFETAAPGRWIVNGRAVSAKRKSACVSLAWCTLERHAVGQDLDWVFFARSAGDVCNRLKRARAWAKSKAPELLPVFEALHVSGDAVTFEPNPDLPSIRVNAG